MGRQIDKSNQDLISYEQIGYLFKREVGYAKSIAEDKYTPGTLISFQEGTEGDPFDEVRQRFTNKLSYSP